MVSCNTEQFLCVTKTVFRYIFVRCIHHIFQVFIYNLPNTACAIIIKHTAESATTWRCFKTAPRWLPWYYACFSFYSNIALQRDILPWMYYDNFEFSFNDPSTPIPLPQKKWKPGRATILTSSHYKMYLAEEKKNKDRPSGDRKGTGKS